MTTLIDNLGYITNQVEELEASNKTVAFQMDNWRERANKLALEVDNLIEERDNAEDLVDELRLKGKGLQIEVDNLAEENGNFANFLEGLDYSPCEVDNIAGGWAIPESIEMSDNDKAIAYYKDRGIQAHENEGAVYCTYPSEDFMQFELELSANEISFRAELYNEQLKMKEEK
jgi:hypothetical protein